MSELNIEIRALNLMDLQPTALKKFNRYQETNRVKYKENDRYLIKYDHFIDHWDDQKKEQVIRSLQQCISKGGFVAGALKDNNIIGFANVENKIFGENNKYIELPYIHVSSEFRNLGIGKKMFLLCCEKARELGAQKLYIASHPAEETQNFYQSVGCLPAIEVNADIFANEQLDIQLEYVL